MNQESIQNPDFKVNRESTISKYYWIVPALGTTGHDDDDDDDDSWNLWYSIRYTLFYVSIESLNFPVRRASLRGILRKFNFLVCSALARLQPWRPIGASTSAYTTLSPSNGEDGNSHHN